MAASHQAVTFKASATNADGATTSGSELDKTAGYDLTICGKVTNGGTGPTTPCMLKIYSGETSGKKRLMTTLVFDKGDGVVSERSYEVPDSWMFVNVDFVGNTGEDVTVECYGQLTTG